jgi:hypothetical protein
MADSKIDFSFENLHFSCEGENVWVEKQLNNVLSRLPALLSVQRKTENIVEEIIDVDEDDVSREVDKAPLKRKVITRKEQISQAPDILTRSVKNSKVRSGERQPDLNSELRSEQKSVFLTPLDLNADILPVRRGRKPKSSDIPLKKGKLSKKRLSGHKMAPESNDSPLFQFLIEKKATKNQVRKFLATAVFLAKGNDSSKLSTPMVSKALKSVGLEKLQNASDCLNKNEKKGYCIKDGKEFIVTENGFLSID